MSDPCTRGGPSTLANPTDTPCLNYALNLHTQYVDLLENYMLKREQTRGGEQALYLHQLSSQILDISEKFSWGADGTYEDLPSTSDLRDVLGAEFRRIEGIMKAFDRRRSDLLSKLASTLSSQQLHDELLSKPYHERIRLTADLLDRLDLYTDGQQLIQTLLINNTPFTIDMCLDAVTHADSDEYLDSNGEFKLSAAGSSETAGKAIGGTIDYLKAVSTTLIGQYAQQGNLSELVEGMGHVVARFDKTLGDQLINNPTAQALKQVKDEFDDQLLDSIRGNIGTAGWNVLLIADQLAAILKLVDLFLSRRGEHDLKSILSIGSEVMKVITGVTELAFQLTKRTLEGGWKLAVRGLSGLANLASVIIAVIDSKNAYHQGDYSVMTGHIITAAGAVGLVTLDIAIMSGASASIAGPIGIVVGLVILLGTLIVIFTADHQIENWFGTSAFGESWNEDQSLYSDPKALQFRWKDGEQTNYTRQASDLISMLRGISVASKFAVGSSDHLRSFWTNTDIQLTVARNELGISEAEESAFQYSVLEVGSPGFEDDTWVFLKRITKQSGVWKVEPIYAVDIDRDHVHSIHPSTASTRTSMREYPDQTEPNTTNLGIWFASRSLRDVYGLSKEAIEADAYLEIDVATLPAGATLADANRMAGDLENQPVPRKRATLEVE